MWVRKLLRVSQRKPMIRSMVNLAPLEDLVITKSCAERIKEIGSDATSISTSESQETSPTSSAQRLRVQVDSGGCSGFQYVFTMENLSEPLDDEDDCVFERDGATVVVDSATLDLVRGSTVDFEDELIRTSFVITNNPNAASGCGCGTSFEVKDEVLEKLDDDDDD
eukprot:g1098.t1